MINYVDKTSILDKEIFMYQKDINDFFTSKNVDKYLENQKELSDDYKSSLIILFDENSNNDICERCKIALEIYPLCFEAFYIAYYLYDSLSYYYFSLEIINHSNSECINDIDTNNLVNIYLLLSSFFMDIKNNKKSIEMLDEASKYISKEILLTRYLITYSFCEDDVKMYELYKEFNFKKGKDFILLIICLLKNNRFNDSEEVYKNMLNTVKYADYLCKPNEIEALNDTDAIDLLNDIDTCFELIESVPYFFSFISDCLENNNKVIN